MIFNKINRLKDKLIKLLPNIKDEFRNCIDINEPNDIDNLMNMTTDYLEGKLQYIEARINTLQTNLGARRKENYKDLVQNMYREDPRRCLRWYVIPNTTPECKLEPDKFIETYERTWSKEKLIENNEEFMLDKIIEAEDNNSYKIRHNRTF